MAAQSGSKTIEEILAEDEGLTIEEALADTPVLATGTDKPLVEYGAGGVVNPPGTGFFPGGEGMMQMFRDMLRDPKGTTLRNALPMAGAVLGGAAGRYAAGAIPALRGAGALAGAGRVALPAIGEGLGVYGGTLQGQQSAGQPVNTKEAAVAGGLQTLMAGATGLAVGPMGRAGGVTREGAATAAMGRPDFVSPVPNSTADRMARGMNATIKALPQTRGRGIIEQGIAAHDAANKKIDAGEVLDAVMKYVTPEGDVHPLDVAASKEVQGVADRLMEAIIREAPDGQMSADQLDRLIRKHFTTKLKKAYSLAPEGKIVSSRLKDVRGELQSILYGALGGEKYEQAGKSASTDLNARSKVKKYFGLDEFGDPKLSTPGRVVAAGSNQNPSGPTLMRKLEELDRANPTAGFHDMVEYLGMKRDWAPSDERSASYMSSMLNIPKGTSPSMLRNIFRWMARGAVRAQGKTGAAARSLVSTHASPYATEILQRAMQQEPR